MKENYMYDEFQEEEVHVRVVIDKYLASWKWFVLGVTVCFVLAYLYLRYTTPQFEASTTILVKDDKKGGILSEVSAFADLGLGGGIKSNVDNEVEILKSRSLVESTVEKLKLNVSIIEKGRVNTRILYNDAPVNAVFSNVNSKFHQSGMKFEYIDVSPNRFKLVSEPTINAEPLLLSKNNEFNYGEVIRTICGDLTITKRQIDISKNTILNEDKSIFIVVSPFDGVVASYRSRIVVTSISKTSSVVSISITDPVPDRAEVFLDNFIQIYNDDAAADKNFISENTSKFISGRLILISEELNGVEKDVESFKKSNSLTDIESEAKLFISGSSEYDKKIVENEIQLNVVSSVLDFMKLSTNADLLPSNVISFGQGDATALINVFNDLVLKRNRLLKSATVTNPTVVKLDQQITSLKSNVAESLSRMQSNLKIQRKNLKNQEVILGTKIGKIPVQERQFRVIERQQKVKEELYLYLLQKREETAISLAATAPNARVIDDGTAAKIPVSPKSNIVYLAALLMGLLIPFGTLYARDLLDTKVKSRLDITNKLNIPFLGDVPKSLTPTEIISVSSRTSTAEALRIVRTNLDFMLNQVPDGKAKTIFLTSTIPGEGKTFLSVNLSGIFALSGKKVLLVGMDIRSPKLNEYLGISDPKGLTDYLSTKNADIKDYLNRYKGYEALDVLLAGSIPPNPTEMLMNTKVDDLFVKFKNEYDYILVDTAPVSLVSDTLIVAKYADTFVYVVRANHMDKRMLEVPETMYREKKLPNMAFLINDTVVKKGYGYGGYGYGGYGVYGYGVEEVKTPWYKKIFK